MAEERVTERLERVCERLGLNLNKLHRESGIPLGTLQHYWGDKAKYKGEKLPDKPWMASLRSYLMTEGMTAEEASDLWGAYFHDRELDAIRHEVADLRGSVNDLVQEVKELKGILSK